MDLAVQGEQQRHGVFRYGMWGIDRDSRDGQFQLLGGADIYVVEPRTAKSHELDPLACQRFQTRPVQLIVDKYANGSGILCRVGGVLRQTELVKMPLDALIGRGALQRVPVVRLRVEYSCGDHRSNGAERHDGARMKRGSLHRQHNSPLDLALP